MTTEVSDYPRSIFNTRGKSSHPRRWLPWLKKGNCRNKKNNVEEGTKRHPVFTTQESLTGKDCSLH